MFSPAPASYIDGVKALHEKLYKAYLEAYKIASKVLPLPISEKCRFEGSNSFRIFIDSSKSEGIYDIKGYFIFGKFICRFLPVSIEPAALFPVRDLSGWDDKDKRKGLDSIDIMGLSGFGDTILYFTRKSDSRVSFPLFNITESDFKLTAKLDDVGLPYYFNDIESLKIIDVPENLLESKYSLVGTQYYAPQSKTKKNCYCVLFAELNNQYDSKAIKVLRWFPQNRTETIEQRLEISKAIKALDRVQHRIRKMTDIMLENTGRIDYSDYSLTSAKSKEAEYKKIISTQNCVGDIFFEMGHISRNHNSELHQFMVENDSRLLFGKIEDNTISIMGGISYFLSSDFSFPLCLTRFNIY